MFLSFSTKKFSSTLIKEIKKTKRNKTFLEVLKVPIFKILLCLKNTYYTYEYLKNTYTYKYLMRN